MTEEMTVGDITKTLDEWFPKRLAASWDNTGLLIGSKKSKIKKILVCLRRGRGMGSRISRFAPPSDVQADSTNYRRFPRGGDPKEYLQE